MHCRSPLCHLSSCWPQRRRKQLLADLRAHDAQLRATQAELALSPAFVYACGNVAAEISPAVLTVICSQVLSPLPCEIPCSDQEDDACASSILLILCHPNCT